MELPYFVMTSLGLGGTCGRVTVTQLLLLGCGKFSDCLQLYWFDL